MHKFDFADSTEEELVLVECLKNEEYADSLDYKITFSYEYIDLSYTQFHFKQHCFETIDIHEYFNCLKSISSLTLNQIQKSKNHSLHFHLYPCGDKKRIIELYKESRNISRFLNHEEIPVFGQFALYTQNDSMASRQENRKSPRVFFAVGSYGVLYPLFFDPYHEILQMSKH